MNLFVGVQKQGVHGDDSSLLTTSANDPSSEIEHNTPMSPIKEELTHNSTMDGIDLSVTLERISAIIVNPADEGRGPEHGSSSINSGYNV